MTGRFPALRGRACGLLAVVCAAVLTARATTLIELSLDQLVQASSVIVRARVVGRESRWNKERTGIFTLTTLEVEIAEKGSPPSTLVVEQPGGEVENVRVRVTGTATLEPGKRYFIFLEPAAGDPARYQPVGMMQGAYAVLRDPSTGEDRVPYPLGRRFREGAPPREALGLPSRTVAAREFRRAIAVAAARPVTIPSGVRIPAVVSSAAPAGKGRVRVAAATTAALFPDRRVVIPLGSRLDGWATLRDSRWEIEWQSVTIRGSRVALDARSAPAEVAEWKNLPVVAEVRAPR